MSRTGRKKMDAIRLLAKASFGDRRSWSLGRIVTTLVLLFLVFGLVGWLVWPSPQLPPLKLAAFDQVALADENVSLCARLGPIDEERRDLNLAGCDLFFLEPRTALRAKVATQRDGTATTTATFAATEVPVEVIVRYPGKDNRQRGDEAKSRVFVWPAEASLLVVDADRVLAATDEEGLWSRNTLDIHPLPGAAAALRKARAKYHIVYLTTGANTPLRYHKLRVWLGQSWAAREEQFPAGPVLAEASGPTATDSRAFPQSVIKDLKQRFSGKVLGITGRVEEARLSQEAGLPTFLLGKVGEVPEGIRVVRSWNELATQLP
jgi:hypothetical protein